MPGTTITTVIDLAAFLDGIEVTDPSTGDTETVDLGVRLGTPDATYLTLSAADLLVQLDRIKVLADEAQMLILDARQDALDAERQTCHYCGTPRSVEPGEDHCGRADCERRFGAEVYADLVLGGI